MHAEFILGSAVSLFISLLNYNIITCCRMNVHVVPPEKKSPLTNHITSIDPRNGNNYGIRLNA